MNKIPIISVIMSVHNSEQFLPFSVESILNQTYRNFEFLIVDDCSTDNSLTLLREYEKKDSRITIFTNPTNIGLTKSLNFLISQSKGTFIARMDDDDISLPKRFEKQIQFFENTTYDIIGCNCDEIDQKGLVTGSKSYPETDLNIKKLMIICNPVSHPAVMFKKEMIEKAGRYNESFRTSQDYDLWFRCAALGCIFYTIQETLLLYRNVRSEFKRKSLRYRIIDMKIRWNGYHLMKIPLHKRIYIFVPFIIGIFPVQFFRFLKKFDPRKLK